MQWSTNSLLAYQLFASCWFIDVHCYMVTKPCKIFKHENFQLKFQALSVSSCYFLRLLMTPNNNFFKKKLNLPIHVLSMDKVVDATTTNQERSVDIVAKRVTKEFDDHNAILNEWTIFISISFLLLGNCDWCCASKTIIISFYFSRFLLLFLKTDGIHLSLTGSKDI